MVAGEKQHGQVWRLRIWVQISRRLINRSPVIHRQVGEQDMQVFIFAQVKQSKGHGILTGLHGINPIFSEKY
jgi:hypothetical protein